MFTPLSRYGYILCFGAGLLLWGPGMIAWKPISRIKRAIRLWLTWYPCPEANQSSADIQMRANRLLYKQALPRHATSGEIQRSQNRKNTCVSHQQFHFTSINDSSVISQPMADWAIFQVDQATLEDKKILWHFRECRKDSGLDRNLCLYHRGDNEEASQPPRKFLHNFTNFKLIPIRKDRTLSAGYRKRLQDSQHAFL